MKAVVFHDVGDIRLDDVPEPKIKDDYDAVVQITASAICGTDLHFIRGTMPGMKKGTILGHEAVGVVEKTGKGVRNIQPGERVIVPSTIACGACAYCRAGYYSQCDIANPAGTAFFGGPEMSGSFAGLQAEKARIPFANIGLVKLPEQVSDEDAILLSDIFPTGYFAAEMAEIKSGDTVAVFGCGPVGLFAIISAQLKNAARVIAVDTVPDRLEMARQLGAEVINFEQEDPVETIKTLTQGIGVDRAIDAVGLDAVKAHKGPAASESSEHSQEFKEELKKIAPKIHPDGENWRPGDGPSQAIIWAAEALAKAGTLSVVGLYGEKSNFPIGICMEKNLTIKGGNCPHRRYIPELLRLVEAGTIKPSTILSKTEPLTGALDAYRAFDRRQPGWLKVELLPRAA